MITDDEHLDTPEKAQEGLKEFLRRHPEFAPTEENFSKLDIAMSGKPYTLRVLSQTYRQYRASFTTREPSQASNDGSIIGKRRPRGTAPSPGPGPTKPKRPELEAYETFFQREGVEASKRKAAKDPSFAKWLERKMREGITDARGQSRAEPLDGPVAVGGKPEPPERWRFREGRYAGAARTGSGYRLYLPARRCLVAEVNQKEKILMLTTNPAYAVPLPATLAQQLAQELAKQGEKVELT